MDPITLGILAVAVAAGLFIKSKPPVNSAASGAMPPPGGSKPAGPVKDIYEPHCINMTHLLERIHSRKPKLFTDRLGTTDFHTLTCSQRKALLTSFINWNYKDLQSIFSNAEILELEAEQGLDAAWDAAKTAYNQSLGIVGDAGASASNAYKTVTKKLGF